MSRTDVPVAPGDILWTPPPDARERFELGRYMKWLASERGLDFPGYQELHRWSISDLEGFWGSLWDFFEIRAHEPYERVLGSREMPGAEWFPGRGSTSRSTCSAATKTPTPWRSSPDRSPGGRSS